MASTTSPGSEPDQYRTGSSLSSGIGLSPGSGTGIGNHIRSMTPDSDSMRTNNTSLSSTGPNARSGSLNMDKTDIFGVRPASSGSANNSGFVVNPENLLNAAAQMASAFAASDMDYLGGRSGQFNDFASTPSASRFTNPQSTTASAFMPPTSKLNPNAPDFMRPSSTTQQDYRMRTQQQQQQQQNLLNKNNFNMIAPQAPPPTAAPPSAQVPPVNNSFNRFNNSNNLPNILTNQGINAYLQSQASHPALNNSTSIDLSAFDTNILSGRSIKEINELIAGATGPPGPPPGPPVPPAGPGPAPGNPGFNYFEPKFNSSRPIGSERSRLEPLLKQPPTNNPWDMSGLYDTLGTASAAVNNDFGGFLGGLDAFNGFANPQQPPPPVATVLANTQIVPPNHQPQPQDYMGTPVMGMTPNVTPSKSDYGDYSVASGLPMMSTAPPGSSSAGKKMGYLDQQAMTGLAGRGDPASVRRNMNQSWGKKVG